MSESSLPGFNRSALPAQTRDGLEQVVPRPPIRRILAFAGRSIDEVINDPVARTEVRIYWKLHKWVERASEISDLERQWNS